jgi:hypothetical protein
MPGLQLQPGSVRCAVELKLAGATDETEWTAVRRGNHYRQARLQLPQLRGWWLWHA